MDNMYQMNILRVLKNSIYHKGQYLDLFSKKSNDFLKFLGGKFYPQTLFISDFYLQLRIYQKI